MKVASFFAGCGGLDLGFEQAGYEVIWANEFDEGIHETYQFNHPKTRGKHPAGCSRNPD